MKLPGMPVVFGIKEIGKAILVIIIAVCIFFGGRYTMSAAPDKKPTILSAAHVSVTIGLDGSINLYDYASNTLIVLPDSMAQQSWVLYNNIIKNQGTQQVPVKTRRVTNDNKTE